MNNETTLLLNKLAEKLGTTADNLWAILLHQAPVDATITLVQSILFVLTPFIVYRVHCRIEKMEYRYGENDAYGLLMILAAVVSAILVIIAVCSMDTIVNGYLNPQYWALEKILDTLKSSK
jgi:uncharacterized Tic20 family protein